MFIDYEKIGLTLRLFFPRQSEKIWEYCNNKKIEQNCSYIKKNRRRVLNKLRKKIKNKPLKVLFYCHECAKWKTQSVYDLMLKDEHFEPIIVVTKTCTDKNNTSYISSEEVKSNYEFFKTKGMNVEYGYDIENNSFIDFKKFKPDIIFYTNPWYIEKNQGPVVCSKYALTCYTPYFVPNTTIFVEYGLRFHQYIQKHYVLNNLIKETYLERQDRKSNNFVVTGHPQLDYFYLNKSNNNKKYVIYAPHWSVGLTEGSYSTFLETGLFILEFAQKHPEINWIFKPHPILKHQIANVAKCWSTEKIEKYYEAWAKIGQVCLHGDYLDLFNESYAMITDCGSFLTEFLLTEQPVIHLVSQNAPEYNEGVKKIVNSYYQAHNIAELKQYLEEVIINKQDSRKQERLDVLEEIGLKNNYAAKNIINDIKEELNA